MRKRLLMVIWILFSIAGTHAQVSDMNNADELFERARQLGDNGRFDEALPLIQRAAKLTPKDIDVQEFLGKCHLELGNYDRARYILRKAADAREFNYTALLYLTTIESLTGRHSSAICYINEMLEQTPYERGLWIRKMNLYREMGNHQEADRELKRLRQIFPDDQHIKDQYVYMLSQKAITNKKEGNYEDAKESFEEILKVEPGNEDTILMLANNELNHNGDHDQALKYVEQGLVHNPNSQALIEKKLGLLEAQGDYSNAISFLQVKQAYLPIDRYRELFVYFSSRAADFYEYEDPYILNKKLYAEDKSNIAALDYVIRESMARGYFIDAEYHLNQGLERFPNDKDLLAKRMELYRRTGNDMLYEKALVNMAARFPNDADIQYEYDLYRFNQGKDYVKEDRLYEAKVRFSELSRKREWKILSLEQLFNICMKQQKYDQANEHLSELKRLEPENKQHDIRESDLFIQLGNYPKAIQTTETLLLLDPDSERVNDVYRSQQMAYIADLMQKKKYQTALRQLSLFSEKATLPEQAYLYGVNAALAERNKNLALDYAERGLTAYPDSNDLKLKTALLYAEARRHDEAYELLLPLHESYPNNDEVAAALAMITYERARRWQARGEYGVAFRLYKESVGYDAAENPALDELIELYKKRDQNRQAIFYLNERIKQQPFNHELLKAKSLVFENMKVYDSALYYQKLYKPDGDYLREQKEDKILYLTRLSAKNEIIATYTRFDSDSTAYTNRLASFMYRRYTSRNVYGAGVNYVGRTSGIGMQANLEWTHTWNEKTFSTANYFYGTDFFPIHKFTGTVFRYFDSDWTGEAGLQYIYLQNEQLLYSAVGGASKFFDNFWVNGKVTLTSDFDDYFSNVLLRSRYFLNQRTDFITLLAATGSAPYDAQLDFQFNTFLDFVYTTVGAGYQDSFANYLSFGVYGYWYHFQTGGDSFVNQYQLTLLLEIKF